MQCSWIWWWCGAAANQSNRAPADLVAPSFAFVQERWVPTPAHTQHVGSISTAYGALRRRRDPQCHQQNSFGTTPARPRPADSSRELQQAVRGPMMGSRGVGTSIDSMADELDDVARGLDIELFCRGSCFFPEEQRPPHRRHRIRTRIDRLVLADVWPQCRRHDTG
jgi:hypothetical protein